MEGLKRSEISFRRQGSSGLVWDDKLVSEELNQVKDKDDGDDQKPDLRRSKSDGGGAKRTTSTYRTVKVEQAEDPPSPRLSACGFCSVFGKPASAKTDTNNNKNKKRTGKPKQVKK